MRTLKCFLVALTCVAAIGASIAGGNCNFLVGTRSLDNNAWDPVSPQPSFGVNVDITPGKAPIALAFGGQVSAREKDDVTYAIAEAYLGFLWKPTVGGNVHPYIGGGVAHVAAAINIDFGRFDEDDDDSSVGYYANGGVYWRLGERFNLGVDARLLRGTEGELFGLTADADYFQTSLLLGFSWGE